MGEGDALKFQVGTIEYKKRGPVFNGMDFPDEEHTKWAHPVCCTNIEPCLLSTERCEICQQPVHEDEGVLIIEEGTLSQVKKFLSFGSLGGGYAHESCAAEWLGTIVWQ